MCTVRVRIMNVNIVKNEGAVENTAAFTSAGVEDAKLQENIMQLKVYLSYVDMGLSKLN